MTLKAYVTARINGVQTGANDFGNHSFAPDILEKITLTDGVGANQADILFADQRTVADGANDDIDLSGALTDAFGATVTMAEVVALLIVNAPITGAANTTDLTIGAGTNPFVGFLGGTTPTIGPIKPGGMVLIAAGDAAGIGTVGAGTADILRVANSAGAAATYQIVVIGRSA